MMQIPLLLWLMMPGDGFSSRHLGYRLVLRGGMGQHSDVDTGESEWVHWQVLYTRDWAGTACMHVTRDTVSGKLERVRHVCRTGRVSTTGGARMS